MAAAAVDVEMIANHSNAATTNNSTVRTHMSSCSHIEMFYESLKHFSSAANGNQDRNDQFSPGELELIHSFEYSLNYEQNAKKYIAHRRNPFQSLYKCNHCQSYSSKLFSCLHCGFTACNRKYKHLIKENNPTNSNPNIKTMTHMHNHVRSSGHALALSLDYSNIYCWYCNDYVYHSEIQQLKYEAIIRQYKRLQQRTDKFILSPQEISSIQQNFDAFQSNSNKLGVRGLVNLGNSCYMSVCIQLLVHNPTIRNFFFSDMHNQLRCQFYKQRTNQIPSNSNAPNPFSQYNSCLACAVDQLFSDMFSGQQTPYIPDRLFHCMWANFDYLAHYAQQDAAEFLLSLLDGLHTACTQPHNNRNNNNLAQETKSLQCQCIVHKTFGLLLRSDVTCSSCNSLFTVIDPALDISLDLATVTNSLGNSGQSAVPFHPSITLWDCLQRFTSPEKLSHSDRYYCNKCNNNTDSTKQLSIQALPTVLTIHIKRFERKNLANAANQPGSGSNKQPQSKKIESHVRFPLTNLDLQQFTALQSHKQERTYNSYFSNPNSHYDLFALIVHKGTLETGHYICYFKNSLDSCWYRNDDKSIVAVTESEVTSAQAYVLCYSKQQINLSVQHEAIQAAFKIIGNNNTNANNGTNNSSTQQQSNNSTNTNAVFNSMLTQAFH
jgi:ubiquitin carboxyl-terminal hydrolase 22/27/51